nr:MAG TPA: hypothetical protein [Caudoviricetes sp.]
MDVIGFSYVCSWNQLEEEEEEGEEEDAARIILAVESCRCTEARAPAPSEGR